MGKRAAIVWFRNDLRLHDNEALHEAISAAEEVLPVYIFDPRVFGAETRKFGFPKVGAHRLTFILQSLAELRKNLRQRGNNLLVRIGKPEDVLLDLTREVRASWVFCNRERTKEELDVQDAVEQQLWTVGREIRYSRGKMLYYTSDLPFPITHTPDVFTQFRKEVEKITPVRDPLPTPVKVPPVVEDDLDFGELPTLADFGLEPPPHDERAAIHFVGGESEGLDRVEEYFFETEAVATYKKTRNGLVGKNYSTKFSAWLAQGCISPKRVYQELKDFEEKVTSNDSTYWVFFELLWREFFRLQGKKYDEKIFLKGGTKGEADPKWREDRDLLQRWIDGTTGVPFIDANMREIARTGFMSNRGRQNVASFLVKDLHLNWQMGAEYFESVLTDYDVTSNWCNWNYVAGVGADPREDRYFNILTQAERYDPKGEYVKLWCPELAGLPPEWIHKPDQLPPNLQEEYGVKIGGHYPKAIVPTSKWSKKGKRPHGNLDRGRKRGRGKSVYR